MNPQPTEIERRYGAKAAQEWSYVLDFLELQTGFSSNLILVPDASAARVCAADLEAFLKTKGQRLEKIEFNTPHDLQEHFAPWLLEGANLDGAGAVWLASVSSAFDPKHSEWQSAWRYGAARVNERRDELIRRYQIPIFVATATWTNETIRQAAPDWWSVRSLVVSLKPEFTPSDFRPEQRERALVMGRLTLQENPSGDELLDPDIALETAAQLRGVKGEEKVLIRMLERAYQGLIYRDRYAEAEAVAREVLAVEEFMNPSILEKADSLNNLGFALLNQGRFEEAEKSFRTELEWKEKGGASLTSRGNTMDFLGRVLLDSGRLTEAETAFRTALEWQELGGDSFASRGITIDSLGHVLLDSGRLAEAEIAFRTALEWTEGGGVSLKSRGTTMHYLGIVFLYSHQLDEAEKAFRKALEWKKTGRASLFNQGITVYSLGLVLEQFGRLEEAEKVFLQSIEIETLSGTPPRFIQITRDALTRVQKLLNRPDPSLKISPENDSNYS
jgi:tetratricopeptide (TPR) repeat protein